MVSLDNAKTVLKPFFFAPTKAKYIREIAKDSELSYERVQHYLKELDRIKAVESKTRGKIKEYSLNRKHDLVLKVFSFLEMERRQKFYSKNPKIGVSLRTIVKETSGTGMRYLILFGSAAREDAKDESDVDLLFVLKDKDDGFEKQMRELAKKMEAISGRRFSMHIVFLDEMKTKWKKEPFYATLWRDHIVLYGDEEFSRDILDLGEPI